MMGFGGKMLQTLEGINIALNTIRTNKIRTKLTIMNIAVNIFVVVALSSVMRGINESFTQDLETTDPTSFYI